MEIHTRPKKYSELSATEALQADCDIKATNIILKKTITTPETNLENKSVNDTLTVELERYKEQVKVLKEGQNVDLKSQDNVSDSCAQSVEIDHLKRTLSEHLKEKEFLLQTITLLKNDFKKEESRNLDREIALEKQIKHLDNIIFKRDQSAQTVHMLTKPQFFYDNTTKQALGFQNPFYLKKAQQLEPMLYVGDIIQKTNPIVIPDSEETLTLAEESRLKMLLKHKDNMMQEKIKQIDTTPIDYAALNQLYKDFETRFVPQTELSAEQAFWSHNSVSSSEPDLSDRPTNVEVPKELPKVSMVNTSLKKLKYHLANFDVVVKERTTPTAITEGTSDLLAHIKHTQEEAAVLRDLVDHIKAHYPLDSALESAFVSGIWTPAAQDMTMRSLSAPPIRQQESRDLGIIYSLVGQFCDSNLEVAFRQHTCYIRNLEGVDLLTGSRGDNLYTLSLGDMMAPSPICLLSKASKTKSWFMGIGVSAAFKLRCCINHLTRTWSCRGLHKLKFEKNHLCSAFALGKSTKKPHKPKSKDTNQEKLYLLHMDLCGPMRVASVNGKKYILVIVDDYSRFIWVKCLRSKDEALAFIINFLKMIQVRLKGNRFLDASEKIM
ncbi:integrase, catalytic region, zinc finger, CCHC-type containing protein [Tanacetum coccineum]